MFFIVVIVSMFSIFGGCGGNASLEKAIGGHFTPAPSNSEPPKSEPSNSGSPVPPAGAVPVPSITEITQGTYYVDSSILTSGNGSSAAPFKTIQEGIDVTSPGETLLVRGDTSSLGRVYPEDLSFPLSGASNLPITIAGYGSERVVIQHAQTIVLNKNFIRLMNLTFDHLWMESDALKLSGSDNLILGCEIRNGKRDGIDIFGNRNTIAKSLIHDFVKLNPRTDAHCTVGNPKLQDLTLEGNTIYNCSGDGFQQCGLDTTPFVDAGQNIILRDNTIFSRLGSGEDENAIDIKNHNRMTISGNHIYGFWNNKAIVIQKFGDSLTIYQNNIHDSFLGIEVRGEGGGIITNTEVSQNVIHHIPASALATVYGLKFDGVVGLKVRHNTLALVGGNAIRVEVAGVKNAFFQNNLVWQSGGSRITSGTPFSNTVLSNNGWFNSPAGPFAGLNDVVGTDPLFIDVGALDFRLLPLSTAIDRGINLGLPFLGVAPDLGAFEAE